MRRASTLSTVLLPAWILIFSPAALAQDEGGETVGATRSAPRGGEAREDEEEEDGAEDAEEEADEAEDAEGETTGSAVRSAPEPEPEPATSETSGTAERPVEKEEAPEAEEPPAERERGLAIGVGTGPLPLNTISFGLTGLAGRVLIPAGPGSLVVSGGHTSFRGASFPQGGFSDRDFGRAGATTVAFGYRGGSPPPGPAVVPYGIGQLMGIRGTTGSGNPGDVWGTGAWSVGGLGGVGVDGFVNPWVSAGVEVGGMAAMMVAGGRAESTSDDKFQGTLLTTFASAQLTVWK